MTVSYFHINTNYTIIVIITLLVLAGVSGWIQNTVIILHFMCFQGNVMGLLVCLMFIPVQIQTMIWKERTPGRRQSGGVRKVLMVVGGGYCGCSVVSIESTRSCHVIPALHCTTYSHHKHPNTQSVSVSTDINPSQNRTVRRSSLIRTTEWRV